MAVLGIDFGTSNSVAAVLIGREVIIVPPAEGPTDEGEVFPSYVAFDSPGNLSAVGLPAKERFVNVGGELVVRHIKRIIGRSYDYVAKEIVAGKRFLDEFRDRIERGKHGEVLIKVGNKQYTPIDIAVFLLEKIYKDAETFAQKQFRVSIDRVVISIPAGLDDMQRKAIFKAGERVFGENKVKVIEEPTAAAIARGMQSTEENMNITVLDVGAGTTDIVTGNVLRSKEGYHFSMTTRSCDDELGGLDMDYLILEYLFKKDQEKPYLSDLYPRLSKRERGRLMAQIERAKIAASLSGRGGVGATLRSGETKKRLDISLEGQKLAKIVTPIVHGYKDERGRLKGVKPLLEKTILKIAGGKDKIDKVNKQINMLILVGGPSKMSCIHEMCEEIFKNNKSLCEALEKIDPIDSFPMECVAKGAALSELRGIKSDTVTPHPVSIFHWEKGKVPIIPKGAPYNRNKGVEMSGLVPVNSGRNFIHIVSEKGDVDEWPEREHVIVLPEDGSLKVTLKWREEGCRAIVEGAGLKEPVPFVEMDNYTTLGNYCNQAFKDYMEGARNLRWRIKYALDQLQLRILLQIKQTLLMKQGAFPPSDNILLDNYILNHRKYGRIIVREYIRREREQFRVSDADLQKCEALDMNKLSKLTLKEIKMMLDEGYFEARKKLAKDRGIPERARKVLDRTFNIQQEVSVDEIIREAENLLEIAQGAGPCRENADLLNDALMKLKQNKQNPVLGYQVANFLSALADCLYGSKVINKQRWNRVRGIVGDYTPRDR